MCGPNAEEPKVTEAGSMSGLGDSKEKPRPVSPADEPTTTVILTVDENPTTVPSMWRNWRFLTMAAAILAYATITEVSNAQISKLVNSPTFSAPFFLMWYMVLTRIFAFPIYLAVRVVHGFITTSTGKFDEFNAPKPKLSSWKVATLTVRDIWRETEKVFGPAGLTLKSGFLYLVPFSLLWSITNGLFYWAVTFTEVSECVAVSCVSIIFVYIIAWIFLKEQFILFKLFGMAVCMAGVVLTVWASGTTFSASRNSLIAAALVVGSSVGLALQTVGFKRYLGSPTLPQIVLYQSLTSFATLVLTWPVFLSLKLTGNEVWDFDSAPLNLMNLSGMFGLTGALTYYLGVSVVSPIFMSLSKPLQIVINNGIDIGIKGITFGLFHILGAGLVIVGFLMLIIPNAWVSLEIRTLIQRLRSGEKSSIKQDVYTIAEGPTI
ncbi:putative Solute carrier family 35 member F4 [Hypsibius exemplaris]|uniref:Solute carrier family 35 member F4 n=1 Tax=Hypsibius exemplaris TaxID=2072580 RepID=A0A1W0WNB0_HYPEX|nr:putative Solute carrier family 35 member F4 [Hypsibius exemplaris]